MTNRSSQARRPSQRRSDLHSHRCQQQSRSVNLLEDVVQVKGRHVPIKYASDPGTPQWRPSYPRRSVWRRFHLGLARRTAQHFRVFWPSPKIFSLNCGPRPTRLNKMTPEKPTCTLWRGRSLQAPPRLQSDPPRSSKAPANVCQKKRLPLNWYERLSREKYNAAASRCTTAPRTKHCMSESTVNYEK